MGKDRERDQSWVQSAKQTKDLESLKIGVLGRELSDRCHTPARRGPGHRSGQVLMLALEELSVARE